jgi:O-methyltransferase
MPSIQRSVKKMIQKFAYMIEKSSQKFDRVMENDFRELVQKCEGFHMQSIDRLYALYQSVKYVVNYEIPGAFVECGVYKGGNPMLMAYELLMLNRSDRMIYLYDTFEGMSTPTEKDVEMISGKNAAQIMKHMEKKELSDWVTASLNQVKNNVLKTGYPENKFVFIQGKVEDTIPATIPDQIAILRLDTDWYESTYHEFVHLFPRLTKGGVLIVDDYGWWKGSKEATDKYLEENHIKILLNRIDRDGGRIGIKS